MLHPLTSSRIYYDFKQDTPIKTKKTSSYRPDVVSKLSTHTSNEDIISVMMSFKGEILALNKRLAKSQSTQFNDLKNSLNRVSSLIATLKAKCSELHGELETLKCSMVVLENKASSVLPQKLFRKS